MSIANYADLRSAMADWLARDDLTARIPDFITMAEATLNKVMRDTRMVGSQSVAIVATDYEVTAPTDMLEPISFFNAANPSQVAEQTSVEQISMLRRHRLKTAGYPRFFALFGRSMELAPVSDAAYTFTLRYYQSIPSLAANETNWLIEHHPEIYIYTSLMHAAPFLNDRARTDVMTSTVVQSVQAALNQNRSATFDTRGPGFTLKSPSDSATTPSAAQALAAATGAK